MDRWQAVIRASSAPLLCVSYLGESHICAQRSLSPVIITAFRFSVALINGIISKAVEISLMFLIIFLIQ